MKTVQVRNMKSRLTVLLIGIFSFACQKTGVMADDHGGNRGTSSVHIFLTDDPSLVFDHVFLDITKVEIKVEDDSEQSHESEHQGEVDDSDSRGEISGGWMAVPIHAGVYDILQFRNGLDTLFGTATFDASRDLKKVRITLGSNNSVVLNGNSSPLTLNGNDHFIVVKLDESSVAINSGGLTNFWVDIDAGRSIRQHGSSFELKPSVKCFSKEKSGGIEGRVLPGNAAAVVMAINGTDTATAKPEAEGEFKFMGLKSGVYTLIYHATANNYIDVTVNNVTVSGTEDVHVPDVTLHQ
jgi:hypothetical protein